MTGGGGMLVVDRQVAGVAAPAIEADVAPGEAALGQHGRGNDVRPHRIFLGVEVVAKHDLPALHRRGEAGIVVELCAQSAVGALESRNFLQVAARQRVERIDARAGIAFRPDHVEAEHRHAELVEQLVHHLGHQGAAPGPAADLAEALLVDVEDDDAPVDAARHGHAQARVVDDVVDLVDEADLVVPGRVPDEEQRDRKADCDPYDVLFQEVPDRSGQAFTKNSILMPASSITSWSFSACGAAPICWPLTSGRLAPSTCVMK